MAWKLVDEVSVLFLGILDHELLQPKVVREYRIVSTVSLIDGFPLNTLDVLKVLALNFLGLEQDLLISIGNAARLEHVLIALSNAFPLFGSDIRLLSLHIMSSVQVVFFESDVLPGFFLGKEADCLRAPVLNSNH